MKSLVSTEWLAEKLGAPDLVILDATVNIIQRDDGRSDGRSGRAEYEGEHIPGAVFADVTVDLADPESRFRFMLPSERRFAAAMEALGVGDGKKVVVYSDSGVWWATRVWWLLKTFGFDNVAILDGGLVKWKHEGRPLSDAVETVSSVTFTPRFRPDRVVYKEDVLAVVKAPDDSTVLVDALSPEYFRGDAGDQFGYGRLGHIPGAVNIPSQELTDPQTGEFLPVEKLRDRFAPLLEKRPERTITYCGGGIAASQAAFALELIGESSVALYDASLQEWAADDALPMEVRER